MDDGDSLSQDNGILSGRVLILNQSYEPLTICSIKKAIILMLLMKAEVVERDSEKLIRSVNMTIPFPSVIRLSRFIHIPYKSIEISRKNIIRRDNNQCQYCGSKKTDMTIDHIVPRSRNGGDTWENLVCACKKCNNKKGNRTLEETGMRLLEKPRKPNHIYFITQTVGRIHENWKPFLFMK